MDKDMKRQIAKLMSNIVNPRKTTGPSGGVTFLLRN